MLDENYSFRVSKLGPPGDAQSVSQERLKQLSDVLPGSYIQFLSEFGIGHYFDRGYQFVDPFEFEGLSKQIFKDDPDLGSAECHLTGFSAFGNVLNFWSPNLWHVQVDLLHARVECRKLAKGNILTKSMLERLKPKNMPTKKPDANRISSSLLPMEFDDIEYWDFLGQPMFKRCVSEYGKLEAGECFAFFPALGLVGDGPRNRIIERIKRVPAKQHFSMLAQMNPFTLQKYSREERRYVVVREIGA